jgi:ferritin-like metal-binding protein YciE
VTQVAEARNQVTRLLREAHSVELHRVAELRAATGGASGAYRAWLESHVEEERRHADHVQARLDQLGGSPGLVEAGLGVVTGIVAMGLRLARRPLDLIENVTTASTSFRGPREQAGAEAFELAGYVALERVAADSGDAETAELAREIQDDERRMLEALEDAMRELADDLAGGPPADAAPAADEAEPEPAMEEPEPEPAAAEPQPELAETTVPDARPPEEDLIGAAEDPSPTVMRETAREAAEEDAEVVAEFSEPGAEQGAGAEVHVDPPWEDYDRMTATEIEDRLHDADAVLAAAVQLYEGSRKQRGTVMRAAERALSEQSEPSRRT